MFRSCLFWSDGQNRAGLRHQAFFPAVLVAPAFEPVLVLLAVLLAAAFEVLLAAAFEVLLAEAFLAVLLAVLASSAAFFWEIAAAFRAERALGFSSEMIFRQSSKVSKLASLPLGIR